MSVVGDIAEIWGDNIVRDPHVLNSIGQRADPIGVLLGNMDVEAAVVASHDARLPVEEGDDREVLEDPYLPFVRTHFIGFFVLSFSFLSVPSLLTTKNK